MEQSSEILRQMYQFSPTIRIDPTGVTPHFLDDLLRIDPKICVYLKSASSSLEQVGFRSQLVLHVEYQNTDVPKKDIHMAETQWELHYIFCQNVGNFRRRIVILSRNQAAVEQAYQRFMNDDFAFYPSLKGMNMRGYSMGNSPYYVFDYSVQYNIGLFQLQTMETEVDKAVKDLAAKMFLPSLSEEAKIYLAHNYLATTILYTLKKDSKLETKYLQSAYGALIRRECVCQGYAEAFKRLMDAAGIDCDVVCGQVAGYADYHAWNAVRLKNGCCYHVDVTWDSHNYNKIFQFFGKTDADFSAARTWERSFTYRCNGGADLLRTARANVLAHKAELLRNGVPLNVIV